MENILVMNLALQESTKMNVTKTKMKTTMMTMMNKSMMNKSRPVFKNPFGVALSEREREVLQLICEELTTAEIAAKLFISPRTVDGHRNSLLQKLGCRNTAGLVIVALQEQLVDVKKIRF